MKKSIIIAISALFSLAGSACGNKANAETGTDTVADSTVNVACDDELLPYVSKLESIATSLCCGSEELGDGMYEVYRTALTLDEKIDLNAVGYTLRTIGDEQYLIIGGLKDRDYNTYGSKASPIINLYRQDGDEIKLILSGYYFRDEWYLTKNQFRSKLVRLVDSVLDTVERNPALSFMLENLDKPVIFTGAQIPLCELRSDGRSNIVTAMLIAASGRVREVCLYFNGRLLRGNRSAKTSSDQLEAFASPNAPPLAEAGISIQYHESSGLPAPTGPFRLQTLKETPIGLLKLFPGIQFELFESIMTEKLRGVVLETFGAGNIPSSGSGALLPIIEKAHRSGSVIVVCSQCMQGTVTLGAYATSKALHDIGAVNGGDMTSAAAMTKLYYLFSKGLDSEQIKAEMVKNLRGELSEVSPA